MSYATAEAMILKFGEREIIQLTDNEEPYQNVINHDKLNAAMEAANSEADGYLSRFPLPLSFVPPFLTHAVCDIARYYALNGAMSENDPIKIRCTEARKTLKDIANGVLRLGGAPAGEAKSVETANTVVYAVGRRDFGGRGW